MEAPRYRGDIAGSLKNDTVIAIALLYLNHACHYHAFFALSRASSHRFFDNVKVMSPCVYRKLWKTLLSYTGRTWYMKQLEPVWDTTVYSYWFLCSWGVCYASPIAFRVILLTPWGQPATGILGVKSWWIRCCLRVHSTSVPSVRRLLFFGQGSRT